MPDIPTNEPLKLRAGDTWKWRREDLTTDYPAPTWTLKYFFKKIDAAFNITATADGTRFSITVARATTAAYSPGAYTWQAIVESATERFLIESGKLDVLRDFEPAGNFDGRSHAKKTLDAIEAVLESRASKDQEEYQIAGRMLKRTPVADLLKLRDRYRQEYAAELRKEAVLDGRGQSNRILVEFVK